jgi:general secretion pathway protein A
MAERLRTADLITEADAAARLAYYNLRVQPFQPTSDPEFLWLGAHHFEILAAMKAGVLENAGLVLLTGDVGTGKTTLAHALEASLGDEVSIARLDYPGLDAPDFFKVLGTAYGLGDGIYNRETFVQRFVPYLTQAHMASRRVLLVLDEAQSLSHALFEEIGHLASLGRENVRLLNILLVGQEELSAIVLGPLHRGLRPHIAARHSVEPLSPAEVDEYIRHRLSVAGASAHLFEPEAIREIAVLSRGVPRVINLIADMALLRGFKLKAETITTEVVSECAREIIPQDSSGRRGLRRRYAVSGTGARRTSLLRRHRRSLVSAMLVALVLVVGYFYTRGPSGERRDSSDLRASPRASDDERGSGAVSERAAAVPPAPAPAPAIEATPAAAAKVEVKTPPPPQVAAPAAAVAAPAAPPSPPPAAVSPAPASLPPPAVSSAPASAPSAPATPAPVTAPAPVVTPPPVSVIAPPGAAPPPAPAKQGANQAAKPPVEPRPAPTPPAAAPPRPRPVPPKEGLAAEPSRQEPVSKVSPSPKTPPAGGVPAREPDNTPDPGAIIDWLLKESPARRE